jgi:hypothetical protein
MQEMKDGSTFVFLNHNIHILACYKAPPLKYINMMLRNNLQSWVDAGARSIMPKKKRDAIVRLQTHLTYRAADAKFMIGILATL